MAGVVVDVMVHPGEVAAAGATLLTVADLSEVRLVVYLPQSQIGRVSLEQGVEVTVDAFPGRVFTGRVVHIADQAEFTPRNVATTEERANLVLAVEILLANEANALKPGMPAEAVFVEEAR
jgi:HlyD family secretion protein